MDWRRASAWLLGLGIVVLFVCALDMVTLTQDPEWVYHTPL